MRIPRSLLIAFLVLTGHCFAAEFEWVLVGDDQRSFVLEKSGHRDHEWVTVEEDLKEMKKLGANVVRIHLWE